MVTNHGLISLERAQLITGEGLTGLVLEDHDGRFVKLTVYGGRSVRTDGRRDTSQLSTCCGNLERPVLRSCSPWTERFTASGSARASSPATRTCR